MTSIDLDRLERQATWQRMKAGDNGGAAIRRMYTRQSVSTVYRDARRAARHAMGATALDDAIRFLKTVEQSSVFDQVP